MTEKTQPRETAVPPITSFWVLVCRVAWLFAGPVMLGFLALAIANRNDGWIAATDLGFLIVLAATVGARWISFHSGDTSNSSGEVTSLDQLRRYSVGFLMGGILVWIATNFIGNQLRS